MRVQSGTGSGTEPSLVLVPSGGPCPRDCCCDRPEPSGLGFSALPDYDVNLIYCSKSQLKLLNINASELIVPVSQLIDDEVNELIMQHDKVLSF